MIFSGLCPLKQARNTWRDGKHPSLYLAAIIGPFGRTQKAKDFAMFWCMAFMDGGWRGFLFEEMRISGA